MPTKELLSAVLNITYNITHIDQAVNGKYVYWYHLTDKSYLAKEQKINIYELAYKCKEWSLNMGYRLESSTFHPSDGGKPYCAIASYVRTQHCFNADTEIEAIFLATQWILENKGTT